MLLIDVRYILENVLFKVVVQPAASADQGVRDINISFAYRVLNVIGLTPTL